MRDDRAPAQLACTVTRGSEVLGYLVIDSTVGGRAGGGLRMQPDIGEAEIRGLARTMTLKHAFLGLPRGGAKAGVCGDPEAPQAERRQRLAAFAQAIAPLLRSRIYTPGTDMGTDSADIRYLLDMAGVYVRHREMRDTPSGYYTGLTVLAGAKQAMLHMNRSWTGCRVAIEGLGKVGSALAELLAAAGARVVAISTYRGAIVNPQGLDVNQLTALAAATGSHVVDCYSGAERIDCAALLELPVDLLCPCARQGSIHAGNAPRVQARLICPGANNAITPDAEQILSERGVLCLPDFVTNCGGALGSAMEFAGSSRELIAALVDRRFGARVAWLLSEAERQGVAPREVAVPLALHRFEQLCHRADHPTPMGRMIGAGQELYRRGWIPAPLMAALSRPYFERLLA
jgi:glutamate dehydrogenase (NAD(P)+)